MKKVFIIFSVFILVAIVWLFVFKDVVSEKVFTFLNKEKIEILETQSWTTVKKIEKKEELSKEEIKEVAQKKIETLRKRFSYKWLIISWDVHAKNSEYILALKNYLEVLKWNPNDEKIAKKIWDTYFSLGSFEKAYSYYSDIKDYINLDKDKVILTLLYSTDITIDNMDYIYSEIDSYEISEEKSFYYKNSISCLKDFHECKVARNEYFENNEPTIKELIDIKEAIENYRNFKIQELYYKNALIIWAFFQNKLYSVAIDLWKNILKDRVWYKPILQIIWKSYYEIGEYNNAKKYLGDYYEQEWDDVNAIYLLGITKMKLGDYLISNIFFDKALDIWYENPIDIKRKMIYNFYKLWESSKMLKMFKSIIEEEENTTVEDISLAIYYHIINDDITFAKDLSIKSIEKYPEEDLFYAYLWWIQKEEGEYDEARINLKKSLSLDSNNPMSNFNMGLLEAINENTVLSKLYFKKTIKLDETGEYWKLAKEELEKLKE